jgi:hypothetical protein
MDKQLQALQLTLHPLETTTPLTPDCHPAVSHDLQLTPVLQVNSASDYGDEVRYGEESSRLVKTELEEIGLLQAETSKVAALTLQVDSLSAQLQELQLEASQMRTRTTQEGLQGSPTARARQLVAELQRQVANSDQVRSLQADIRQLQDQVEHYREQLHTNAQETLILQKQVELERRKALDSKSQTALYRGKVEDLQRTAFEKEAQISVLTLQVEELEMKPECSVAVNELAFEVRPCLKEAVGVQCKAALSLETHAIFDRIPSSKDASEQTQTLLSISNHEVCIPAAVKELSVSSQSVADISFKRRPDRVMTARLLSPSESSAESPLPLTRRPTRNFAVRKAPMEEFFTLVRYSQTAQSVKLNSSHKDDLYDVPLDVLYSRVLEEQVPFFKVSI